MARFSNSGALSGYYGDGYLSGGEFAEGKKQDGRKLTKEETTQRLQQGMSLGEWRKMVDSNGDLREPYRSQQIAAIQRGEGTLTPENAPAPPQAGALAPPPVAPPVAPQNPVLTLEDEYGNLGPEFGDAPVTGPVPGQEGYIAPVEEGIPLGQPPQQRQNNPQNYSRVLEEAQQQQSPRIPFGEAMGRYGGAILSAGNRGGLAQLGAMGNTTGVIGDKNREMEQQQYDNDLALYNAQKLTAKKKGADKSSGEIADNIERVSHLDYLISRLDEEGDNVTGPKDGTYGALKDNLSGHPRATLRLQLSQVRVSAALKNVAETKGAISNREMDLFLSPMPKMGLHQEGVWRDWLSMQSALGKILNNRLKGEQLSDGTMSSKIALDRELEGELAAYYAKYRKGNSWSFGGSDEADDVASKYL